MRRPIWSYTTFRRMSFPFWWMEGDKRGRDRIRGTLAAEWKRLEIRRPEAVPAFYTFLPVYFLW